MKTKKTVHKERNWVLVVVCVFLIIVGLSTCAVAIVYAADFGWWSLAIGLGGLTTTAAAITSIAKNDPVWILLDLIIPG